MEMQEKSSKGFRVVKGRGRKKLRKIENLLYLLAFLVVVLLLLQIGYHWISSWIYSCQIEMERAEPGKLRSHYQGKGIITRNEKVIESSEEGIFVKKVPAGERVARGEKVGYLLYNLDVWLEDSRKDSGDDQQLWVWLALQDLFGEAQGSGGEEEDAILRYRYQNFFPRVKFYAASPGVISYQVDGMESYAPHNLPYEILSSQQQEEETGKEESQSGERTDNFFRVEKNEPVFKIVDNWEWYFSISLGLEEGRELAEPETVKILFPFAQERELTGEKWEKKVDSQNEQVIVTYRLEEEVPNFQKVRKAEATIYFQKYQGLIIPAAALEEKEGEKGVYINQGGVIDYREVEVVHIQGKKAVIEGIDPYSIVVTTPGLVEEGQRLE